jgi:hypothetical protein
MEPHFDSILIFGFRFIINFHPFDFESKSNSSQINKVTSITELILFLI